MAEKVVERYDLTKRESNILILLIRRYVDTKKPVPSSYFYDVYSEKLSPSTIRAILNKLEKKGFLKKEHISSGRTPTDLSYKYFAEVAINQLPLLEIKGGIKRGYDSNKDIKELAQTLAERISQKHHIVAFATAPSLLDARLDSFELYPLSGGRVVVFCLSKNGRLYERVIESKQVYTYEKLRYFGNYITQNYKGWTFREIRTHLNNQVIKERRKLTEWITEALTLISPALHQLPLDVDLFLSGIEWIAEIPEIARDSSSLKMFLETIERKEKLLGLIEAIMEKGKESVIVLGSELPVSVNFLPLAILSVSYGDPVSGKGVIGMIGGKAMKYDEALQNLAASAFLLEKAAIGSALIGGD